MNNLKNERKNVLIDLTGQKFGRLTVIGRDTDRPSKKTYWVCQCDCGNFKSVRADSLNAGAIRSCGCLHNEVFAKNAMNKQKRIAQERGFTVTGTRLYYIWQGIKKRCYNTNDARYHRYGGRGITVCEEWITDYINFHNWAIENGYSEDKTIDRIDNDGNYEPSNCRWSTNKEQCNNRSSNIKITIGNATKTLTEWCEIFEIDFKAVIGRYHRNENITLDELFRTIPR